MDNEKLLPKGNKPPPATPDPGGAVPQTFRAGVGAMIVNRAGLVLLLERRDIPGSWQMVQGGLDGDETPQEAVLREIEEETGIPAAALERIAAVDRLLAYELPGPARTAKTGRGQVQYWFIFRFVGCDAQITLGDGLEFTAWQWATVEAAAAGVVEFKKPLYRELVEYHHRLDL